MTAYCSDPSVLAPAAEVVEDRAPLHLPPGCGGDGPEDRTHR